MRSLSLFAAEICLCLSAHAQVPELGRWQDLGFPVRDVHLRSSFEYQGQLVELASEGRLDDDPDLLHRAQTIMERLARTARQMKPESASWHWEIHVTSDPSVNAQCMAGGKLLIGSAFVREMQLDDGELAVLISHEMAHALADHYRETLSSAYRISSLPATSLEVVMLQLDSDLSIQLRLARLSAIQEKEADQLGMILAHRAGWPTHAIVRFYEKLAANEKPSALSFSHPPAASRLSMAKGMARLFGE